MKKWIILSIIIAIPLFLVSTFVVWPPDIFTGAHHTVATCSLSNGHSFAVVQYWNHIDFYSTELHHRFPDGHVAVETLDGDDAKSWRIPITVDVQKQVVTVILSGHRVKTVSY
jgi:hypothetical protein